MSDDEKTERYLFDPEAPASDVVVEIEDLLRPLRYDAAAKPLRVERPRNRRRAVWLAVAAVIAAAIAGAAAWMWSWPEQRPWDVVTGPMARLDVGRTVDAEEPLVVRVARIGWMRIAEGSVLTLRSTSSNHHRLEMREGTLHVSIWAPPRSVAVRTPAGEVIDFGCEFILRVDASVTSVDVVSGWVRLDNEEGEVLVPGGATSSMRRSGLPSVPLFHSATADFAAAIRTLERDPADGRAAETAVRQARRRDVITLLLLGQREPQLREMFVARAAELMPPRSEATVAAARRGDATAVQEWIDELPLPPRNWVPNWRDRLPFRLR